MENPAPRWQQLAALSRRLVTSSRHGRSGVRFLCALLAFATCGLTDLSAQAGTGSVQGRIENAISGSALNLARVTVKGTNRETFSNEYGDYQLAGLPAGEVELTVSYTGLAAQTVKVTVAAGIATTQDFQITSARMAEAGPGDDALKLDTFTVSTQRDTNAASIATERAALLLQPEERGLGGCVRRRHRGQRRRVHEIPAGRLGGLCGGRCAHHVGARLCRQLHERRGQRRPHGQLLLRRRQPLLRVRAGLHQQRVAHRDLQGRPRPSMPADSLGGAVNLVSKNAFERKGAELKYKVYLSLNSEDLDLFRKTDGPMNKRTYKALPGFDFDYTLPVSKTFGLVVTGLSSNQFNEQHRTQNTYEFARAGATATNPYLQQYQFQDGPKNTFRDSLSVKADWKVRPHHVLSASLQTNYYLSQFGNRNFAYNIGTSATPTTTGGRPSPGPRPPSRRQRPRQRAGADLLPRQIRRDHRRQHHLDLQGERVGGRCQPERLPFADLVSRHRARPLQRGAHGAGRGFPHQLQRHQPPAPRQHQHLQRGRHPDRSHAAQQLHHHLRPRQPDRRLRPVRGRQSQRQV
jgi:iron complex outermembrane receptor protein